jgi:hypothetical protein
MVKIVFVLLTVACALAQRTNLEINRDGYQVCKDGLIEARAITQKQLADWDKGMADCSSHMPTSRCRDALRISAKLGQECRKSSDQAILDALRELERVDLKGDPEEVLSKLSTIAKGGIRKSEECWDKFRFQMQGMLALKVEQVTPKP